MYYNNYTTQRIINVIQIWLTLFPAKHLEESSLQYEFEF